MDYTIYTGIVERGYELASGKGIYNPFGGSTIDQQLPHFRARGFDLGEQIPGFFLGTMNITIDKQLRIKNPDKTLEEVNWTDTTPPENFSFTRCCLIYKAHYFTGLIYYPHPETKPRANTHFFNRLEVITIPIPGMKYGEEVSVVCRADVFEEFN